MPIQRQQRNWVMASFVGACVAGAPARAGPTTSTSPFITVQASVSTTPGPFQPSWQSLHQYKTPDWYRRAKFGIWAHWSAQCVPEQGDWYARSMYVQGDHDYDYQVAHYGHPSKVGFKDIDNLWHAEHWDPQALMKLYVAAGAQYFVALANHHDNFDTWDSAYQPWNSTKIGPHRDIIGEWSKAARAAGLHFGVTVHASHAWNWFEVAQGSDKTGPLAGVTYDGKLTAADGKGQWWDGLNPQDLYAQNHTPGNFSWNWDVSAGSSTPDQAYVDRFYNRTIDLIHKYHPDLVYFDDSVLPFAGISDAGLRIASEYYNSSLAAHGGEQQAVMTTKDLNEDQRKCLCWDIERGLADRVEPFHWQTDTCIGQWHYNRAVYDRHWYKTADLVIHMLADIVSKNGNLLLNIPLRGDGTIDSDEHDVLTKLAAWMAVNKQAVVDTEPWDVYGEGPSTDPANLKKAASFNEDKQHFFASDIRFTKNGDTLNAILLGWPSDGKVTIRSLKNRPEKITGVHLLGSDAKLSPTPGPDGLMLTLPPAPPCESACVIQMTLTK